MSVSTIVLCYCIAIAVVMLAQIAYLETASPRPMIWPWYVIGARKNAPARVFWRFIAMLLSPIFAAVALVLLAILIPLLLVAMSLDYLIE